MVFGILFIVAFTSYSCYAQETEKGLLGYLNDCAADNGWYGVLECGTNRVMKELKKASLKPDVEIFSGVHLISDEPVSERIAKSLKNQKLTLNSTNKQETDTLFHSISRFLSGRSLKMRIPEVLTESSARAAQSKPKKNLVGPLLLGLGATLLTMVPVMMGGLALLSSKAVLLSKIAMVVSMILFVQYFFNHGKSIFPSNNGMIGLAPYAYGPSYPYPYFGVAAHSVQEKPSYRRNVLR